jgi:hypothetical protein|tara:strand:- start:1155 stop:1406 length:252 start_codon:yes stop_codon:yes gene_type:complete
MVNFFKHPIKFVTKQIRKELFSFAGLLLTSALLVYGYITDASIKLSTLNAIDGGNIFAIRITTLALIGMIISILLIIYRNVKK